MTILRSGNISGSGMRSSYFLHFASLLFLILTIISCLVPALADEFHYNNLLIGERSASMGGAYTALSNDPSGSYYNPAGIVFAEKSLSVSVNAYSRSQKQYNKALISAESGTYDWNQVSSRLLPNFFGFVQPFGSGKVGFSYAVPDSILRDQQQTFYIIRSNYIGGNITRYVININDVDNSYNFGPSYAIKLNDSLSVGATIYAHYRDNNIIRNQLLTFEDNAFEWINFYESSTEWGYRPMLGIMWLPMKNISMGLTASKTDILSSKHSIQNTHREPSAFTGWDDPNAINFNSNDNVNSKRKFPLTATIGVAYSPSSSLLLAGDVTYYYKVSNDKKETYNISIGTEYYLTKKVALRAGFFTDKANTPELTSSKTDQNEHIDINGYSLSISRFTSSSSITIGGNYASGIGEAQVISGSNAIQEAEIHNLTLFISTGYTY